MVQKSREKSSERRSMAEAKTVNLTIETRAREPASESFTFRTTPSEAKDIKDVASKLKITPSDLIRSSLHSTGIIGK